MSAADLVFRNARVVDGTGAPSFSADVAVAGGRIAEIGRFAGSAREEIDAAGKVLAPGFIDIHTHFDPQLCWDRLATPSLEHGVTTVVVGSCSLSLAPVRREGRAKLVSLFQVIEDIRKPTFDAAVPFAWESFAEYLDHIRPGLGINVGALVGHSALRYYVMGEASQERSASEAELARMVELLEAAMDAGALGLSSSYVDVDERMRPVPSRFADLREKIALCRAVARSGRGVFQVVPFFPVLERQLANIRELGEISRATGVLCSIQPILSTPASPLARESIEAIEQERAKGARVYGQVMPRCFDLHLRLSETSMLLYELPAWKAAMDLPLAERRQRFVGDRERLVAELRRPRGLGAAIPFLRVGRVQAPENQRYAGRGVSEIAASEGRELGEVILDIALADELEAEFRLAGVLNADAEAVAALLDHPSLHFGASDAGAHVTQFCGTGDTTHLLEHFVRRTGRMTLERAVQRMTGELARDWGLSDRGTLLRGKAADLVLFDPARVACGAEEFVRDFPGEANRYLRRSTGYSAVAVGGEIVWRDGRYTGARPGRIV